ncbi:unnamed protein product [Sympodiomycopsis kandeliae]
MQREGFASDVNQATLSPSCLCDKSRNQNSKRALGSSRSSSAGERLKTCRNGHYGKRLYACITDQQLGTQIHQK